MRVPEQLQAGDLTLRRSRTSDADVIFKRYARDPEVVRYLTWKRHETIEDTIEFLKFLDRRWSDNTRFAFAIEESERLELCGMIEVRIDRHEAVAGYVLARPYWGRGIMTKALRAVVQLFLSQPEIYRFSAVCDVDNLGSARVMQKAGMTREGTLRRYMLHPNVSDEPRDCYCYSATK